MSNSLQLAVNMSIYDGYDLEEALFSVKKCGYNYFELAYNLGYVSKVNSELFSEDNANYINKLKHKHNLTVSALGCTMNLADDNMVAAFKERIKFAHMIGAPFLNTCVAKKDEHNVVVANLKQIVPDLNKYGCILCIENAGDYDYNAFTSLADGVNMLNEVASNAIALNWDPGNMVTYAAHLDINQQAMDAITYCKHFHIKDVKIINEEFYFCTIGDGIIDYSEIVKQLAVKNIPVSFEIPLKMHRLKDSTPIRSEHKVDIDIIENTLVASLNYVKKLVNVK